MQSIFLSVWGVIVLLSTAMMQADKFTDKAIKAVDLKGSGTTSEKIIKDGLTDVAQFDIGEWKTTKLKEPNQIPQGNIRRIDILEKIDKDYKISKDKELTDKGKAVFEKKMSIAPDGKEVLIDLKNGWFDFWPDKYYRWDWDFWKIAPSLFVIGMTLLFTAIKLGKLCFELAFSYILANLVAPADVANGQKTKHILLNILNSFLIMIMIFISLKLYLIGMDYIHENMKGIPYVMALICLSLAVVDGPVICERIFGIDAGLKNGWGVVAGGYALGKGISKATGDIASKAGNMLKSTGKGALQAGAGAAGIANGYKNAGKTNGGEQKEQKQAKEQQGKENGKESTEKQGDANGGANGTGHSSIHDEMGQSGSGTEKSQASQGEASGGAMSLQDEMKSSGFDKEAKNEGQGSSANVSGGMQSGGSGAPTSASGTPQLGSSGAPSGTQGKSQPGSSGAPTSASGTPQLGSSGAPSGTQGKSQPGSSGAPTSASGTPQLGSSGAPSGTQGTSRPDSNGAPSSAPGTSQPGSSGVPSSAPEPSQPSYSGTSSSGESSSGSSRPVDTAPSSTNDIPAPQRENRTIGQYAKDRLSNSFNNSPTVQQTKRSYQLGQNTGESLRNKGQNKGESQKPNVNQNQRRDNRKDA
ncbi:pLS20_p028 family conjugation system transmembrane protein [Bacillus cereus]